MYTDYIDQRDYFLAFILLVALLVIAILAYRLSKYRWFVNACLIIFALLTASAMVTFFIMLFAKY